MPTPYEQSLGGRIAAEWGEAQERAEDVLESLLDDRQRADRRRRGLFWMATPFGTVRLGRYMDVRFQPRVEADVSYVLCLDFEGPYANWIPKADLWASTALQLAAQPQHVLGSANWLSVRGKRPGLIAALHADVANTHGLERARGLLKLGAVLNMSHHQEGAIVHLRRARTSFARGGDVLGEVKARVELVDALIRLDDTRAARAEMRAARDAATPLTATAGARRPKAPVTTAAGVSDREVRSTDWLRWAWRNDLDAAQAETASLLDRYTAYVG
jgi:hypothetical protein